MSAHFHKDENGLLVRCYHKSKDILLSGSFWVGVTLSFPIEHFLWERVWPFRVISEWMGL